MVYRIAGFGWRRDMNDIRDFTPETPKIKQINEMAKLSVLDEEKTKKVTTQTKLPEMVDNRKFCSPVETQGNLGSCTSHMGVSMLEYMERKSYGQGNGTFVNGSRLFLYKTTRFLMGVEGKGDSGAYIRTTLGAIRLFGVPPEEYWPYSDDLNKFDREPSNLVTSMAKEFQSVSHFRLDYSKDSEQNITRMKQYVSNGYALGCGFTVFDSYDQAGKNGGMFPFPSPKEGIQGGHAIMIAGYDDKKVVKNEIDGNMVTGAFLLQNSWGEKWGEKGYGWLPYSYFRAGANGDVLADDCWTITKLSWLETGQFSF